MSLVAVARESLTTRSSGYAFAPRGFNKNAWDALTWILPNPTETKDE